MSEFLWAIAAVLFTTYTLGYISASSRALGKMHVKYFNRLFIIFYAEKSVSFLLMVFERYFDFSSNIMLIMNIAYVTLQVSFYFYLLFFLNSFYGIINVKRTVILTGLYFLGFIFNVFDTDTWINTNGRTNIFLKNTVSLPFLFYIIFISLKLAGKASDRLLKRLLACSVTILGSIAAVIFIDGFLEAVTDINLPKETFQVFIYSAVSLLYMNSVWDFFSPDHKPELSGYVKKYGLTKREEEITGYLLEGHSYKSISHTLCISLPTVKTHIHNIYSKTGQEGRFALISSILAYK